MTGQARRSPREAMGTPTDTRRAAPSVRASTHARAGPPATSGDPSNAATATATAPTAPTTTTRNSTVPWVLVLPAAAARAAPTDATAASSTVSVRPSNVDAVGSVATTVSAPT